VLTVRDVLAGLERYAPPAKAAEWDPVGLQVGDLGRAVRTAAVCHEVTGAVLEVIATDPVDVLVTYHPLLFEPVVRFIAGAHPAGRALRLAELGVALAVAHTNADVAAGGAADALADALGIVDAVGFAPTWGVGSLKVTVFVPAGDADRVADAMTEAGAGVIGDYTGCSFRVPGVGTFRAPAHASPAVGIAGETTRAEEVRLEMVVPASWRDAVVAALAAAHPYEEPAYDVVERRGDAGFAGRIGAAPAAATVADVAERVRSSLGGVVRVAGEPRRPVERLAVVPGSGSAMIPAAADAGADAVVTGDVGHHRARVALERGMAVIDPGHAATERPGVARLYAAVAALVPGARDLTATDADPWRGP
jgi:dinuclear metal center YbgI/SA1388 family protein